MFSPTVAERSWKDPSVYPLPPPPPPSLPPFPPNKPLPPAPPAGERGAPSVAVIEYPGLNPLLIK